MNKVFGLGRSKHPIPATMAIGTDAKHTKPIGFEPKQYEFECNCGYIWIDSQNTGCPMCSEKDGITVKPYEIKQPKEFNKK